ncbi:hypothetical protein B0T19DRAFT_71277 [Cercophora scortea]|uniref:Uncharacterized protein n=1 Tax=Cercophora scortea TaxID=314031 RepID=A0AAE0J5P7_9PEZI|nr:hypothetical protein B0T19DRAFT_71277 [Cercophora scortea]
MARLDSFLFACLSFLFFFSLVPAESRSVGLASRGGRVPNQGMSMFGHRRQIWRGWRGREQLQDRKAEFCARRLSWRDSEDRRCTSWICEGRKMPDGVTGSTTKEWVTDIFGGPHRAKEETWNCVLAVVGTKRINCPPVTLTKEIKLSKRSKSQVRPRWRDKGKGKGSTGVTG